MSHHSILAEFLSITCALYLDLPGRRFQVRSQPTLRKFCSQCRQTDWILRAIIVHRLFGLWVNKLSMMKARRNALCNSEKLCQRRKAMRNAFVFMRIEAGWWMNDSRLAFQSKTNKQLIKTWPEHWRTHSWSFPGENNLPLKSDSSSAESESRSGPAFSSQCTYFRSHICANLRFSIFYVKISWKAMPPKSVWPSLRRQLLKPGRVSGVSKVWVGPSTKNRLLTAGTVLPEMSSA